VFHCELLFVLIHLHLNLIVILFVAVVFQVYLAIQEFGVGNWSSIVNAKLLPGRSNMDIKDKWRTMCKQKRIEILAKKFGPISDLH